VADQVRRSVDGGARLTTGGASLPGAGFYFTPTVLADVPRDAAAAQEEVFGPVAPVLRFRDADEAAALAGASEYGLSLGIISRDVMAALELADRIPTGIVHINDQTVNDEAVAPFGGVGASGTGARFGGPAANIEAFTEAQWVTVRGAVPQYPF
jgi:benzaldehyde dehydrogenase (NAD)